MVILFSNLHKKGVEYYESLHDERQIYFKKKLQTLMSHPSILQQSQEKTKNAIINQPKTAPAPAKPHHQH